MNKNRLLSLFLKYLNPPVNINGLILKAQVGFDSIIWEIENPNNLSYSTEVVEGYLQELLYEFQISTGTKDLPEWKNCWNKYCKVNDSDVHINRELANKINQQCDRLNIIKLVDGDTLTADCYVRDWSIEYPDTESLYVHVDLELSNPQIIGDDNEPKDIDNDTLSEFIEEFRYNDTSQEQETDILWEIMIPIMDNPNMYDRDYMFSVGLIKFYDNFGDNLG
jgi:hypothetical protein